MRRCGKGGYRLRLVYNVTLAGRRRKKGLGAPSYGAVTAKVAELLGAWRETGEPERRVVTLEQQYTRDGLTPDKLKGVDPGLVRRFLSEIVPNDGSAEIHNEFAKLGRRHGLNAFEAELKQVLDAPSESTLLRNAKLLHLLCRQPDRDKYDAALCTRLCESAVAGLERFDARPPKNTWEYRKIDRAGLLVTLVSTMIEIGAKRPLRKLIDHTLEYRGNLREAFQ